MDMLHAWIKQIILLVLFATFLELLIPSNNYKKFIKVVMGLLILLAVLQPMLDLLHKQWSENDTAGVTARVANHPKTFARQSTDLQSERDRIAMGQYRKELIKQIKVLAGAVEGVADVTAEVVFNEEKGDKGYGMIKKVTVYAKAGETDKGDALVAPVKTVEVGSAAPGLQAHPPLDEQKKEQIKKVITEFYHLKIEQADIKDWMNN